MNGLVHWEKKLLTPLAYVVEITMNRVVES